MAWVMVKGREVIGEECWRESRDDDRLEGRVKAGLPEE